MQPVDPRFRSGPDRGFPRGGSERSERQAGPSGGRTLRAGRPPSTLARALIVVLAALVVVVVIGRTWTQLPLPAIYLSAYGWAWLRGPTDIDGDGVVLPGLWGRRRRIAWTEVDAVLKPSMRDMRAGLLLTDGTVVTLPAADAHVAEIASIGGKQLLTSVVPPDPIPTSGARRPSATDDERDLQRRSDNLDRQRAELAAALTRLAPTRARR